MYIQTTVQLDPINLYLCLAREFTCSFTWISVGIETLVTAFSEYGLKPTWGCLLSLVNFTSQMLFKVADMDTNT